MPIKLGPAGIPLSCKGRTIVEGMDDIISLGLETMEVQTVRMIAPQHFEQYWQAGVLANKTEFENRQEKPIATLSSHFRLNKNRAPRSPRAKLETAPK